MTDRALARILLQAPETELSPIPFPVPPKPVRAWRHPTTPLPQVDAVVMAYTYAEGQALADVLSPGWRFEDWSKDATDFGSYLPDLTSRSPAKDARCLAYWALTHIGDLSVLLLKSELHLATDSLALPLRRYIANVVRLTGCSLWIDTGTAGGIGPSVVEGDAVCAGNLVFDCTGAFKDEPYAHLSFACTYPAPTDWTLAESLMAANAHLLSAVAPRAPVVHDADVITCDSFLFDDAEDTYGLQRYDGGRALVEEMDCAVLGLVASDFQAQGETMPPFISVRSVSDPQIPDLGSIEKEEERAEQIYDDFGYPAQVETLAGPVYQLLHDARL